MRLSVAARSVISLAGLALIAATIVAVEVPPALAVRTAPVNPTISCAARIPLAPVEEPGWPWQEHRMWLVATFVYDGSRYSVVNERTNLAYPWAHSHDEGGRAWFSVRTRWALLNPSWKDGPWVLLSHCSPTRHGAQGLLQSPNRPRARAEATIRPTQFKPIPDPPVV